MNWITIFDLCWLTAVLVLLFLIWRSSERRLKHVQTMEKTLVDVSNKNAESAQKAVLATQQALDLLRERIAKQEASHVAQQPS